MGASGQEFGDVGRGVFALVDCPGNHESPPSACWVGFRFRASIAEGYRMSVTGDGAGNESDHAGEERADGVNNLADNVKHGGYLSVEVVVRRGAGVAPLRSR